MAVAAAEVVGLAILVSILKFRLNYINNLKNLKG
jgi:NADH:ubiquinone oxidoreductase subunit K